MTDEEFEAFLGDAMEELLQKQDALSKEYGLGTQGRFVVDYESGVLTFFGKERAVAEAEIVPLATHVPEKSSLKWAWANEQYPQEVRDEAAAAKILHQITGFELFVQEFAECDEEMAWEITAMACKALGRLGAYRVPHASLHSYVLIKQIRHCSAGGH